MSIQYPSPKYSGGISPINCDPSLLLGDYNCATITNTQLSILRSPSGLCESLLLAINSEYLFICLYRMRACLLEDICMNILNLWKIETVQMATPFPLRFKGNCHREADKDGVFLMAMAVMISKDSPGRQIRQ
jgi:hypothetical protein